MLYTIGAIALDIGLSMTVYQHSSWLRGGGYPIYGVYTEG